MRRTTWLIAALAVNLAIVGATASVGHAAGALDAAPASSVPDQVLVWNQELSTVLVAPGAQPATIQPTRTMAITQLAVYHAVKTVEGGHSSPQSDTSAQAAAAAAAHAALVALLPTQKPALDAKFQESLAQLGSGTPVRQGIQVGEEAAKEVLDERADDGSATVVPPYQPQPGPGEYQITPPNNPTPVFTGWGKVRPFVLDSGDQFRPPAPPAVTSPNYADDFNQVKSLGQLNSTTRSQNQTDIAKFWSAGPVWIVWNQIAQQAAAQAHTSLGQNARLFAQLDVSLADGVIALYDAKYAYHFWRPVTAVRAAGTDGNDATAGDPAWLPLFNTAPDPSYPGAHAEISQSAASALRNFFGNDVVDISLSNAGVPGVVREFHSFSAAADEAAESRIFAGQHFLFDENAGQALGDQVGDLVSRSCL
ncbi:vanadium-dependent haloperoxidase [Kitasatospora sp. NPDC057904]|uniref:vanadium-dependent haloperoxidase n=1 Tax=unclassified Kitasatospora TaxID=2633591 RepID=UPI0036DA4ED2